MKEIVKVMLQEGIDVDTIHEVLDVIEEGLADLAANAIAGSDKGRGNKTEIAWGKHPHIMGAASKIDNLGRKIQKVGNKVADKVANVVTNSNDPISKGIRNTKIGQNTLGKRAMKNAHQQAQKAQSEVDWEVKRPGSVEQKAFDPNNRYPELVKKRNSAVQNAVKTGQQWGKKYDTSNYN